MSTPPRVLQVFFDWGHSWPLWESGSDKYAMEPQDYGFSPELAEVLAQWEAAWKPIADFDMGETEEPPTAEQIERYDWLRVEGLRGILAETPPEVVVQVDGEDAARLTPPA